MRITDDRPTYAYLVEGELSIGTLADWTHAREQAHYSGLDVSEHVWRAVGGDSLVPIKPSVAESYSADDYAYSTWCVGDDEATQRIDLRA